MNHVISFVGFQGTNVSFPRWWDQFWTGKLDLIFNWNSKWKKVSRNFNIQRDPFAFLREFFGWRDAQRRKVMKFRELISMIRRTLRSARFKLILFEFNQVVGTCHVTLLKWFWWFSTNWTWRRRRRNIRQKFHELVGGHLEGQVQSSGIVVKVRHVVQTWDFRLRCFSCCSRTRAVSSPKLRYRNKFVTNSKCPTFSIHSINGSMQIRPMIPRTLKIERDRHVRPLERTFLWKLFFKKKVGHFIIGEKALN